ncbi:hypothetical protein F2Q70_00030002 [Brassica cretica]|uniref:Uncharacterized protein n=1 Tax=Brassica cretica TaxID=69181 RepID=A0A8S9HA06_BRACR|nr:hypothetical protein F2Q70_00030002 [Brassica cretica]KAF2553666.1 hypothetical protein F2Q68_00033606 [Brassica cretica]
MVKITEAEFLGLPPPSFEHEPKVPGGAEKKTPEPSAGFLMNIEELKDPGCLGSLEPLDV